MECRARGGTDPARPPGRLRNLREPEGGAGARLGHEPFRGVHAARNEAPSVVPGLREDFLHGVLGRFEVLQHAHGRGIHRRPAEVVQLLQADGISLGHPLKKRVCGCGARCGP